MKKYINTKIFIVVVAILSILLVWMSAWTVILNIQNYSLKHRVVSTMADMDKTNDRYDKMKAENDATNSENAALEKENLDLKFKLEAAQKEIKDAKSLLNKVSAKKMIEAEKALAAQNSPQATVIPQSKVCYLTFDDGPSDRTLEILKILDQYNAKATFFVVGTAKLQYLPQIVEKGHTIGLHSNTHNYSKIYKSTDAFFNDLTALSQKVYDVAGIHSKVIRFPGGSSNNVSKSYCKGVMTRLTSQVKIKGYAYFDWNVDSGDASGKNVPAKTITNNVLTAAAKKNSICVLMHDTSSKKTTVEALPEILKGLKAMGYRFEALNEKCFGFQHTVRN